MTIIFDEKSLLALYTAEKTPDNIFLTWKAGTGKSTLLRAFIANTQKNIAVLAPTWIAALNINGSTIHSFFRIPPTITEKTVKKEAQRAIGNPKFTELDAIVIDEISMVRADLFDCIDKYLQIVCENKLPFGGKQMIMIGDVFQLPPVVTSNESSFFREEYPNPYFFSSKVITSGKFKFRIHELEQVYRQNNQTFLDILQGIRTKNLTDEMLDLLNRRVIEDEERDIAPWEMYLAGRNDRVNEINTRKLGQLEHPPHMFQAKIKGAMKKKEKSYPNDEFLQLKVGAQVMFIVNDGDGRWVNGTLGTVRGIEKNTITVQIFGGEKVEVKPFTRNMSQYVHNSEQHRLEAEIIGSFCQIPLKLAWACTIHKSQGKTFEKVIIDLKGGSFAHGQTYVALSRCRSLEGLKLVAPLCTEHVILDECVVEFMDEKKMEMAIEVEMEIQDTPLLPDFATETENRSDTPKEVEMKWRVDKKIPSKKWKRADWWTTLQTTLELLQSGKSIAEIAEIRELSHGTIEEHLMKLYALDQLPPSEFMKFVNRDNVEKVKESYPVYAETKRIGEVKRMLEEKNLNDISYFDIKVAISMIEKGEL